MIPAIMAIGLRLFGCLLLGFPEFLLGLLVGLLLPP